MENAKEIFQAAREAETELKILRAKQRHYIEMASGMSGMSETHIRSNENRSRVEKAALELVEISDEIDEAAEKYTAAIRRAEKIVRKIEKPRYRQVLELRYLSGLSWRSIADEMRYTDIKSAFRVHGWALMEAQKILKCG